MKTRTVETRLSIVIPVDGSVRISQPSSLLRISKWADDIPLPRFFSAFRAFSSTLMMAVQFGAAPEGCVDAPKE